MKNDSKALRDKIMSDIHDMNNTTILRAAALLIGDYQTTPDKKEAADRAEILCNLIINAVGTESTAGLQAAYNLMQDAERITTDISIMSRVYDEKDADKRVRNAEDNIMSDCFGKDDIDALKKASREIGFLSCIGLVIETMTSRKTAQFQPLPKLRRE